MKKTLAYTMTAILLGIALMLFPLLTLFPSETSTMRGLAPSPPPAPEAYAKDTRKGAEVVGIAPFPSSLVYAGFIFTLGFLVALGVSRFFKRRIV